MSSINRRKKNQQLVFVHKQVHCNPVHIKTNISEITHIL